MGGWDPFVPERLITKSTGNLLYELDGQSALHISKKYLGEHAADEVLAVHHSGIVKSFVALGEVEARHKNLCKALSDAAGKKETFAAAHKKTQGDDEKNRG